MTQKTFNTSKTYSSHSFKTNQDSHFLCPNCKTTHEDLKTQIATLKQKAHQSFMQVLQIQQLHDQELSQLRQQFEEKENSLQATVDRQEEELSRLRKQLQQLERNVKKHSIDFGVKQLVIDNIESIGCQDEDRSYLDESALIHFKDLLTARNGQDYVASLRRQIYRDIKFVSNNKTQIEKLFMVIKQLKDQNALSIKHYHQEKEKVQKMQALLQASKATCDSLTKENIFISQNLKRLGNDKLQLQKKVSDLERRKNIEDSHSVMSPTLKRKSSREDSGEKTDRVLEVLREETVTNQLNYACLMLEKESEPVRFNMKKSMMQLRSSER